MDDCDILRELNSRERRRLKVLKMLPIDAVSPTHSPRGSEIIDFYHYGCGLDDSKAKMRIKKGFKKCSSLRFFL
jgi:hypothetical protein